MPVTHIGSCACWETMHRSKSQSSATSTCSPSPKPRFSFRPMSRPRHPGLPTTRPPNGATAGRCVISGFHSPGKRSVANFPARLAAYYHLPGTLVAPASAPEWKQPLAGGRLLVLSPFAARENRVTAALATRRNEFVAALADEVWFAHITAGGELERLSKRVASWAAPPPLAVEMPKTEARDHF